MGKNIVLCSDGTGNQDVKNRGTNVFKLYEAVDIQGHKTEGCAQQVAFYDDGVGTANAFAKVVGGAFGWGFSRNVKKMYRELVNVYEAGDKIFLFGFSRGAYTARALAGFIQYCGVMDASHYGDLPRKELTDQINRSWDAFSKIAFTNADAKERRGKIHSAPIAERREAAIARRKQNHAVIVNPDDSIDVAFVGVWDTVGAIATPFDGLRDFISRYIHPIWFADNTLGSEVGRACHALALDEERRTFHPELWNEQDGADQRVKQVWFSGVHSNVGGGYSKQGMSLVTLDWMMNEARKAGLLFIDTDLYFVHKHQDVHDKLYDSRAGLAVYYRWSPRDLGELCAEHKIVAPKIHISVFERIANGTTGENGIDTYSPGNIPFNLEVDASGSIGSWPSATVAAQIPSLMRSQMAAGGKTSLLADMSEVVQSGKRSYYAFLLVTFIALLAVVLAGLRVLCGHSRYDCYAWGAGGALFFVLGSVAVHGWSTSVDSALNKKYAEFWHRCRRELRNKMFVFPGGPPCSP